MLQGSKHKHERVVRLTCRLQGSKHERVVRLTCRVTGE